MSSDSVLFLNDGGYSTLVLDDPTAHTGQIFGFAGINLQNSDLIDLKGIVFDAGTSWAYQDYAGSNTGGVLTIYETTNGITSTVYKISFGDGEYATANFILATDGHGGTLIADPPPGSGAAAVEGTNAFNSKGAGTDLQLLQTFATLHTSDRTAASDSNTNLNSGTTPNNENGAVSGADHLAGTLALLSDTGSYFAFSFVTQDAPGSGNQLFASTIVNSGSPQVDVAKPAAHDDASGRNSASMERGGPDFVVTSSANVDFGTSATGRPKPEDSFHFYGLLSGSDGTHAIDPTVVSSIAHNEYAKGTGGALARFQIARLPINSWVIIRLTTVSMFCRDEGFRCCCSV
jgi:hypothetical protein